MRKEDLGSGSGKTTNSLYWIIAPRYDNTTWSSLNLDFNLHVIICDQLNGNVIVRKAGLVHGYYRQQYGSHENVLKGGYVDPNSNYICKCMFMIMLIGMNKFHCV